MNLTRLYSVTLAIALSAVAVFGKPSIDEHDILLLIPTPQELLNSQLPSHYRVGITLGGEIADEIGASLAQMKFQSPQFEEVMARKGEFSLRLCNADYTRETQEMVSGALNPADMIDIVINSVVKYRNPGQFNLLKKETSIAVAPAGWNNHPSLRIEISPRGNRFGYAYEDRGAFIQETWLSRISLLMDSTSHLLYEMTCRKHSRRTLADQTTPPATDSTTVRYVFAYDTAGTGMVPARLDVIVNDSLAMVVSASYRREGKHLVFDTRSVCYGATGHADPCMMMKYGTYDFSMARVKEVSAAQSKTAGKDLTEAARMADNATRELKAGHIAASIRLLEKLVERHPQTPHAIQARKLLAGLPGGF